MTQPTRSAASAPLPVTQSLTYVYVLSALTGIGMAAASLLGLLMPGSLYPSQKLVQTFMPNDLVNLCLGVPALAGAMWLTGRGRALGLLLWPGAMGYVLYNYLVYLFGLPFSLGFGLYLAVVALSAYGLIGLVASLDGKAVQTRLRGVVPERLGGGVLAGFGALFCLRAVGVATGALLNHGTLSALELSPLVADGLVTPAWIIGGVLLWRRAPLGYAASLGLLFQASLLFAGLIVVLLLQPVLLAAPFAPADVMVVGVMGLICFVPFGLFVRGAMSQD